jgi:hypothetical protein
MGLNYAGDATHQIDAADLWVESMSKGAEAGGGSGF